MKNLVLAALLISGASVYSSGENKGESAYERLLNHPHLAKYGLFVGSFAYALRDAWGNEYLYNPCERQLKRAISKKGPAAYVAYSLVIRTGSAIVFGDSIDRERARLRRIENMLKEKQEKSN